MLLLGIDYGSKRVGVASTDETGRFALPRTVIENDAELVAKLIKLAREQKVEKIILGESRNLDGTPNPILADIQKLKTELESRGEIVELHPEVYTSMEAEQLQGHNEMHDASAAALILKSYIDSHDHNR